MRKTIILKAALAILLTAIVAFAQEVLTNDSVVKLTKAGITEGLIVNMINSQPGNYKVGTDDVLALKKEGVSDKVIGAMLRRSSGSPIEAPSYVSPSSPNGYPTEIGVFLKKGDQWQEVQPEVVNWKTGGVLKSIASMGVVKGDVNGHIEGRQSKNRVSTPLEFVIVAPEGISITEYQLLKLNQHSDNREFRTVTGGVFHAKGGSTRDMLPFEGTKIAPRYFSVILTGLTRGEYGFLPPGGVTSMATNSTLGKMYSFGVD